ncbi:MAG: hypothetical protein ACM3Y8_14130 [Byssovorax cruenta]|jgi:hypothetical protein
MLELTEFYMPMLRIGFLRCHFDQDVNRAIDSAERRSPNLQYTLDKSVQSRDERIHVALKEEIERLGSLNTVCVEMNVIIGRDSQSLKQWVAK